MASGHIDDAEPAHADAGSAVGIKAFVVGSAMADHSAHFAQCRGVRPRVAFKFKTPAMPHIQCFSA